MNIDTRLENEITKAFTITITPDILNANSSSRIGENTQISNIRNGIIQKGTLSMDKLLQRCIDKINPKGKKTNTINYNIIKKIETLYTTCQAALREQQERIKQYIFIYKDTIPYHDTTSYDTNFNGILLIIETCIRLLDQFIKDIKDVFTENHEQYGTSEKNVIDKKYKLVTLLYTSINNTSRTLTLLLQQYKQSFTFINQFDI